jgi:hypothetical protein
MSEGFSTEYSRHTLDTETSVVIVVLFLALSFVRIREEVCKVRGGQHVESLLVADAKKAVGMAELVRRDPTPD